MSSGSEHNLQLDKIAPPPTEPSKEPDSKSQAEEATFSRVEKIAKLKLAARHMLAQEELISDLRSDKQSLASELNRVRSDLNDLRPRYDSLFSSRSIAAIYSVFGTLLMGFGGGSMSLSGLCDKWSTACILWSAVGVTLIVVGGAILLLAQMSGWPKNK